MSACSKIQDMLPVSPDDVSPEEYRRIKEHLEGCAVCRQIQQELLALDRAAAEIAKERAESLVSRGLLK